MRGRHSRLFGQGIDTGGHIKVLCGVGIPQSAFTNHQLVDAERPASLRIGGVFWTEGPVVGAIAQPSQRDVRAREFQGINHHFTSQQRPELERRACHLCAGRGAGFCVLPWADESWRVLQNQLCALHGDAGYPAVPALFEGLRPVPGSGQVAFHRKLSSARFADGLVQPGLGAIPVPLGQSHRANREQPHHAHRHTPGYAYPAAALPP